MISCLRSEHVVVRFERTRVCSRKSYHHHHTCASHPQHHSQRSHHILSIIPGHHHMSSFFAFAFYRQRTRRNIILLARTTPICCRANIASLCLSSTAITPTVAQQIIPNAPTGEKLRTAYPCRPHCCNRFLIATSICTQLVGLPPSSTRLSPKFKFQAFATTPRSYFHSVTNVRSSK